ncbi:hypothetical protein FE783_12835 [Paenibacillus mesophilus]|uniref:hypothetical protein n=1 Tax=Paenibacillus mesophilus TaxID=2582849 RepID=UPI00110EB97C|nr:hypothetical protein [Paenibacillus mesophilus]TMV49393.1 hypothetical protein FE783_12835 [Paenibacillus mesophilus]
MIQTVKFKNYLWDSEECIVLRLNPHPLAPLALMDMSFPFHEDMPNLKLEPAAALDLRNAIDGVFTVKALPMPEVIVSDAPEMPQFIEYHPVKLASLLDVSSRVFDRMVNDYRLKPDDMKFVVHHLQTTLNTVYPNRKD